MTCLTMKSTSEWDGASNFLHVVNVINKILYLLDTYINYPANYCLIFSIKSLGKSNKSATLSINQVRKADLIYLNYCKLVYMKFHLEAYLLLHQSNAYQCYIWEQIKA